MKLTQLQLEKILKTGALKGLVIYGEDDGVAFSIFSFVKQFLLSAGYENSLFILTEDGAVQGFCLDLLGSSLFESKKLVCGLQYQTREMQDDILPTLQAFNCENTFFIISCESKLDAKNKLRKFTEESEDIGIITCYHDDDQSLEILASDFLKRYSFVFEPSVSVTIAKLFSRNRAEMLSELEKLVLYKQGSSNITIKDVEDVLLQSQNFNIVDAVDAFYLLDITRFLHIASYLNADGLPSSVIVSSIISHFFVLFDIVSEVSSGSDSDSVIRRKGIFFKRVPFVNKQLSIWTLQRLYKLGAQLSEIEEKTRLFYEIDFEILENFAMLCAFFYVRKA